MNRMVKALGVACITMLGLFTPLRAQNAEFAAAASPTTGTFVFTFAVTISSTLPKNTVLVCNASANVSEAGPNILQKATGIGTISGTTGTCKVTMPYSWALATPTTDKVVLSYSVEVDYALQVTASNGTSVTAVPVALDRINENLGTISVPLSGATTNESVSARI